MAVFGFSVTEAILFLPLKCYNALKEVIYMKGLEDCVQELKFISEDLRAVKSVALMADENRDWDTEGDIVRAIALAVGPIMKDLDDVIEKLGTEISTDSAYVQ